MKHYIYQNKLVSKKQLRQILGWSFTNYNSMQACAIADELKYLGFKYATHAGISISIEDLHVPFIKNLMLEKANQEIIDSEKIFLKGKITEVERFQKIIDTWSLTSESLKDQIIYYFKNYDPLNSVYIMAFSGARGNLSQVRQLVGIRGLMSDPNGEIMNLPIKHNFREGLTITDYLMSGYGARKGIVDTALKTANSGYLTRRLIDVAQDILIREKDCKTMDSILIMQNSFSEKLIGQVLSKSVYDSTNSKLLGKRNSQITPLLFNVLKQKEVSKLYVRSPLTCNLYRAICQQCYGWDLATENLVDMGEAVGILAGQSIGEPGTQLTMRTFHTGGIFTSEVSQQLISSTSGIVRFSKFLETFVLRTNRGEEVLVTKNAGSLIIIPTSLDENIAKIQLSRNTILFPKHNQYIKKDTVIGELINVNKQLKQEIKPIIVSTSGEITIPKLKTKMDSLENNKLIWLLSGKFYTSPQSSYLNFHSDYKINKDSYIFRTKIINPYRGIIKYKNLKKNLYEQKVSIQNNIVYFPNAMIKHLKKSFGNYTSILTFNNQKYLLNSIIRNFKTYLKITRKQKFAKLVVNTYKTNVGGILFYDLHVLSHFNFSKNKIYFSDQKFSGLFKFTNFYRTVIWLDEETYNLNCESELLLVENGDFISKNFEIIPERFSKTSGLINIKEQNNIIQTIEIKSGLVYNLRKSFYSSKKLFFPGEFILSSIMVTKPSLCEQINGKNGPQLLIRSVKLYELPYIQKITQIFKNQDSFEKKLKIGKTAHFIYKSNQLIKTFNPLNLITEFLYLRISESFLNFLNIQLINDRKQKKVNLQILKDLNLNNYILPSLKYKNLKSSLLLQKNQFIDTYAILLYIETISLNPLEIVKFKVNQKDIKEILLISNDNCIKIKRNLLTRKKIGDFILNSQNTKYIGKIILENKQFFTIQKGQPYFFPKCNVKKLNKQSNLQYKILPLKRTNNQIQINKKLFLNYYNRFKLCVKTEPIKYSNSKNNRKLANLKIEFSKLFLKKNGKLYGSLIPRFLQQYHIKSKMLNIPTSSLLSNIFSYPKKLVNDPNLFLERRLLIRTSEINNKNSHYSNLAFIKFMEYPFTKSMKSIGLYSITEDFFEQELNSIFCYDKQFLEDGNTIGLLNLEKEITGDIVQGLPRIEEILEARKKTQTLKRKPASQKKGLLTQQTSLNENFEFYKLGTPFKENEKINPHKLIKVYFNYYGLIKPLFCDEKKSVIYSRLIHNFEGTYKSFKKVQCFILNSVQNVYESQGVTINNKHIEVIIQQMTTKVLITDEGDTPLLKREVIDLYHIHSINKIIENGRKQQAYYLPLLFGITKAALNNPSFISAASFQETTRVLTKAAIEGRIDWLRGLKENIIIGHLIPAGTGSRNFKQSFKKKVITDFEQLI